MAEVAVGQLRFRPRGAEPAPSLLRLVANLIGLEVDRAKAPERASEAAVADFVDDLLGRRMPDGETVAARAAELGCDLSQGASVIVARARPQHPEEGDWRARVLTVAERGARAVERTALAALVSPGWVARHGQASEATAVPRAGASW